MKKIDRKQITLFVIVFVVFMFIELMVDFILLGGILLFLSVKSMVMIEKLKKKGREQLGKYVDFNSDYKGYKTPVIEYKTHTGEVIQQEPQYYVSTDLDRFRSYRDKIGTPVKIIYDPENQRFSSKN